MICLWTRRNPRTLCLLLLRNESLFYHVKLLVCKESITVICVRVKY
jgi:hypothetical protein